MGEDYFGLFLVRQKQSQGKRYAMIFNCLALQAVHLEISHSLDIDSFILALRCFLAQRGQVKEVHSDNGTNFVGGGKELFVRIESWNQVAIHQCLLHKGIAWIFNPPLASHHTGMWERLIRLPRHIIGGLVKEQNPTMKASRPQYVKPKVPLTPNHLLLLRQDVPLPPGIFEKSDTLSRRWQ